MSYETYITQPTSITPLLLLITLSLLALRIYRTDTDGSMVLPSGDCLSPAYTAFRLWRGFRFRVLCHCENRLGIAYAIPAQLWGISMAITVNHYANGEWSVTGIPLDRNILANSLYHYGELKPNYPVPAIRYELELYPDSVALLNVSDKCSWTSWHAKNY